MAFTFTGIWVENQRRNALFVALTLASVRVEDKRWLANNRALALTCFWI